MDFNFQALFSHINLTNEQMKAILQDFWSKNEENQSEIGRLREKDAESQDEISRLRHENDKLKSENCKLRQENNEHQGENFRLSQENEQNQHEFALLQHENDDKLAAAVERKISEVRIQMEQSKPSCPVCFEYFDTEARQPYALSCPHMVCAQCLYPALERRHRRLGYSNKLHHEYESEGIGRAHPSRKCPVCRTRVIAPLKKICLNS